MPFQLDDLLTAPPLLHMNGTLLWGMHEDVLRHLDTALEPGSRTLETGAGLSTLVFAARSSEHTCITPSQQEIDHIRAYARQKNISLDHVHFITGYSQDILPGLRRENLDCVLIDGGHGFPIPALDWFYTAPMLKPGGVVIIDDVQLWTGLELKRFLAREEAWQHVRNFSRSTAYAKVGLEYAREWSYQPYVVRKSRLPQLLHLLKSVLGSRLKHAFAKLAGAHRP